MGTVSLPAMRLAAISIAGRRQVPGISPTSVVSRTSGSKSLFWSLFAGILLFGVGCDYAQIYEGYIVEDAQSGARELRADEKIEPGTVTPVPDAWVRIAILGQAQPPMHADKDGHWHCAKLWGSPRGRIYPLDLSVGGSGYEPYSTQLLLNDDEMRHMILVRVRREPK